ncbi:uncharacterized protein LOC127728042 [Mytilus californianus]|uniref:uncharacterized protein LOC127728042 n=1 Tax=Mytilus californianus TaxID=6549 RepID=UPI0022450E78|nr:uncharacterized protein LOC127728042 [Mytilus californianus]
MSSYALSFIVLFGYCSCAAVEVDQCVTNLDKVIAQMNFDIKQFGGAWYTHSVTPYAFGDDTWDSMTHMIYIREDETITSVVSGYRKESDNCNLYLNIMTKVGTAEYSGTYMQDTNKFKILYTDYNSAALIFCFDVKDDGTCDRRKLQFEIWSRSSDNMTTDVITSLVSYFHGIKCTDEHDMTVMVQGNCETPSSADPEKQEGECVYAPNESFFVVAKERPTGDYHTAFVGVPEGEQAISTSYKFTPSKDNNVLYVTRSYQRNDTCSEIDIGKYYRIAPGHYLQIGSSLPMEFWISKGENYLGMFICYERKAGRCIKSQVQRLIQHNQPIKLDSVEDAKNKLSIICYKYEIYVYQTAGLCTVPDLINNMISVKDALYYAPETVTQRIMSRIGSMQTGLCQLSNIPIDESFKISQLSGLWYEIMRPINAANQYESAMMYFHLNEDSSLHAFYSGAINNKCIPPVLRHTKQLAGSSHDAEMMTRLHGPDELFKWVHFKMVYYDGTYSLYYICFETDDNGNCKHAEAMVYGRKRTIDEATRERILSLFPSLCLSTDFLQDTVHNVDCSYWVIPQKDLKPGPDYCNVKDVPAQKVVNKKQMAGSWYAIAGTRTEISRFDLTQIGNHYEENAIGKKDGVCTTVFSSTAINYGQENNGEMLISFQNQEYRGYFTGKVIYTDYQVAVVYLCEDETIHGECLQYKVSILSRTQTLDSMGRSLLEAKLKLPCGDLSVNLQTITDHCKKEQSCRVDDIPAMETVDIPKILGKWYDIMYRKRLNTSESGAVKFSLAEYGHIHADFTSLGPDGTCVKPPLYVNMKRRNAKAEFLTTPVSILKRPGFVPFKILFTDYVQTIVVYVCIDVQINQECSEKGKRLAIFSRTKSITSATKEQLMQFVDLACMNRDEIIEVKQEVDCLTTL